jgi:chitodextrinase
VISGTAEQGSALSTSDGAWSGNTPMTFSYGWKRCHSSGARCEDITDATSTTYTPVSADIGMSIRSVVTASNAAGTRSATSAPTEAVRADATPPSAPGNPQLTGATETTVSIAWAASTDAVGVTGYGVYRTGTLAGSTSGTTYTLSGLACGTSYALAVDATDAAGNRSAKAPLTASTTACADGQAPTAPTGLTRTGSTTTSISVSWSASTDNVGVAGYGKYQNGTLVTTSAGTTYAFSGLTCGTTYTLAVDAVDAMGNRSGKASLAAATSGCASAPPDTTPPSVPDNMVQAGATATTITTSWSPSTDNVGVTGYRLYKNNVLTGTTAQTSYTFTGLTCGTTYSIGLTAVDAAGNESNVIFAQGPESTSACSGGDTTPPSTPTALATSAVSQTGITLSWGASTDNVGVAGYGRYLNGALLSSATGTSFAFTGLSCGTTYALGVDAYDAAGNRSSRVSVNATTGACSGGDTTPPSTPTGLTTTAISQTGITLGWNTSTDNVGVTGYGRYRDGTLLSSASGTSYTYSGLSCGTTYALSVDAYDAAGNRSARATVNATTSACSDTTPPSTPTGLATSAIGQTSITLSWNASTDNVGVVGYGRYRDATLLSSASGTSFTFPGLACGTSYTLAVDAYDTAGNRSAKASVNATTSACVADTTPPSVPDNEVTTGVTQTTVSLAWSPSTDNVGVTGYRLYKNNVLAGTTAQTNYTFTGLTCGTTYLMGLTAVDAAGNESNVVFAQGPETTSPCATADTAAPSTPTALVTSSISQTSITLSWSPSSDNVAVAGYGRYLNGTLLTSATGTSHSFTSLSCGTTYTLAVDAYDAAGNRSTKASVSAATSACTGGDTTSPSIPTGLLTSAIGQTSITLSWSPSTDNVAVAGYGRYRDGSLLSTGTVTSYTYTGLDCSTTYALAVDAYDAAGNRSARATVNTTTSACPTDTAAPSTPTGLVTSAISQTSITLSWTASIDVVGVTGYGRYRDGTLLSSGTGTSYTFSGLTCGTSYTLAVDAYDAAGNRSAKASVNGTTNACPSPSGASVFLSPSGSDSSACTQSAPCRSFGRGYAMAQLGQTVEVAGGSYGDQGFSGSKSGSGVVTFRPASGAAVSTGDMSLNGQNHIEFQNMTIDNWYAKYVSDITFRNINQRFFFVRVSSNVRILGGSVGPSQDGTSPTIGNYAGESPSTNITVEGVLFHDIGRQNAPGAHVECLFLQEASGVVIRNNKFTRCDIMDLYVSPVQGGITASNVTVENNWFDQPTDGGYYAFNIHPDGSAPPSNFTFRYNSVAGSIYLYDGFNYSNVVIDSNIGRIALCGQSGISYRYNVWTNQKCGTTDKVAAAGFTNEAGFDLHLTSASAAINAGNPAAYPATDIDGQGRPLGGAPDAGSDER